ncbi:hypothetical protein N7471_006621 [Penicillium samsonianum]|uniref:uncharacterized protein n=1 Tax=Penicillium samsonianum TaxID=1882272 RepID=UPI0025480433|nr:uncharacterized protein N7471_006621 [Penicillium samsonianum]KAJ6140135.1 hypothetical protein N7471_006621 [Penicillium samsonianum]
MTLSSIFRLALHRKEKKPISHQSKTSKLHNGHIPAEILDLIYEQLPALEQIFFALTCKDLYTHFVSFLKTKDPDHVKLLIPREKRPPIYRNAELEKRPRIQLLRQLENERWKSCVVCMNLHPRSAFEPSKHSNKGSHCYKCRVLHGIDCIPFAGLVDICPCLSIAFNERQLVEAMVSSMEAREPLFPEDFTRNSYAMRISHECKVGHFYAEVGIVTKLYMEKAIKVDGQPTSLHVHNTYTFEFSEEFSGVSGGICPHKETNKWLRQFFIDAGLDYSAWGAKASPMVTEPHVFKVSTMRDLGYRNWNKRGWKDNRNDRG